MRVVLIRNYEPDGQQSMLRFADCLAASLHAHDVDVRVVAPPQLVARTRDLHSGAGKWLGYVDKFVFFPPALASLVRRLPAGTVFHICDHGNAMYARWLKQRPHLITCHDLLAVRGALGEDTGCPPSRLGVFLQRWVLRGLERSMAVACVSHATATDFRRLARAFSGKLSVVHNGLNAPYARISPANAWERLASTPLKQGERFLLHVGSAELRKNREGVLRIFSRLPEGTVERLVFAGDKLTTEQRALAASLGVARRIVEMPGIPNLVLEGLYNTAFALLFPSKAEGFGWPVLEAQACGCPVVCSDRTAIPEIAGTGAFVHSLDDERGFAASILKLRDPSVREVMVSRGLENASSFTLGNMVDGYLRLYRALLGQVDAVNDLVRR